MSDLSFRSEDSRFGLHVPALQVRRILHFCMLAGRKETGGVIAGLYNSQLTCAFVRTIGGPPPDSEAGHTWFKRGISGLGTWFDRLWHRENSHFLGEWHFHPFASPNPSATDRKQMEKIASDTNWQCKTPILLIVGGDPRHQWSMTATVFPSGERPQHLTRVTSLDVSQGNQR